MSSPDHRVLQACAGGDGGGDGRGSQGVEVQIRSSGVDFGLVEVVSQAIGGDMTAVRACDDEIVWMFAPARFFYKLSELGWDWLRRVASWCLRGFEVSVLVGGMADSQGLRFWIPVLYLQADHFADSQI